MNAMQLFFYVRRMKRKIAEFNLEGLRSAANIFPGLFAMCDRTRKPIQELEDFFVHKVLLLVTGIDDLMRMLKSVQTPSTKYKIIAAYGQRTRFVSDIIMLLPFLRDGIIKDQFNNLKGHELEEMLVTRAKELGKADKSNSKNEAVIATICMLAEKIHDPGDLGFGSQSAEEIVVFVAIPMVENNVRAAVKIANSFSSRPGAHRFLMAYLDAYGISSSFQARKIAEAIRGNDFFGDRIAQRILEITNDAGISISHRLWMKIREISLGDPRRSREKKSQRVDSFFIMLCSNCPSLPSCENERADAVRSFMGLPKIPDLSMFEEMGFISGEGFFPEEIVLGDGMGVFIRATKVDDGAMASMFQKIENDLLEFARNGELHMVEINGLPVDEFMKKYEKEISPETRAIVEAALAA